MRITAATFLLIAIFAMSLFSKTPKDTTASGAVYKFTMDNIDGKPVPLSSYDGKVLMIVNTASECGFTPQYESLEKLYEKYKAKGFRILAFPANNFGQQEPGPNDSIKAFCSTKFHTTFDLFSKSSVKGKDINPLYKYITQDSPVRGEIKWNFQKYLVDKHGNLVAMFPSATDPLKKEVTSKIEELLK